MTGNVDEALSTLWGYACGDPNMDTNTALKRGILWGAISSMHPPLPTVANRKIMSKYGRHEEMEITPDVVDRGRSSTTTTEKRVSGSPGIRTTTDTRIVRSKVRALTSKARSIAARIKNEAPRIIGVLECSHINPKWVQAVMTSIAGTGIGPGTRKLWKDSLEKGVLLIQAIFQILF